MSINALILKTRRDSMKNLALGALLSATVFLSACSQNPMERFENAIEKTGRLEQYKMSVAGDINMTSPDDAKDNSQDRNGNLDFDILAHVDKEATKADVTYSSMGRTVDMEITGNSEQTIAKLPLTDKWVIMPSNTEGAIDLEKYKGSLQSLSREIYQEIGKTVKEDGEISLDKTEIKFPTGTKEVDKGTVELESQEVKALIIRIAEKLYSNESVQDMVEQQSRNALTAEEREREVRRIRNNLESIEIEDFEYIVYIDENDYIVGQDLKMNIKMDRNRENIPVDIKSRIWDMEKDQNIKLPNVNEENSITWEEYMENVKIELPEELKQIEITKDVEVKDIDIPNTTTE